MPTEQLVWTPFLTCLIICPALTDTPENQEALDCNPSSRTSLHFIFSSSSNRCQLTPTSAWTDLCSCLSNPGFYRRHLERVTAFGLSRWSSIPLFRLTVTTETIYVPRLGKTAALEYVPISGRCSLRSRRL